jgi:hypothetical protein
MRVTNSLCVGSNCALHLNVEAFRELPKYAPDGLIGLHLARNGQPVLLVGPRIAWEVHYERAIRYAVYGMFCGTNAAAEKTNSN